MVIEIKPETERLVRNEIQSGHFTSIDEIIETGVRARMDTHAEPASDPRTSREQAAAHMRARRKGTRLPPDVSIHDLIHEGRD